MDTEWHDEAFFLDDGPTDSYLTELMGYARNQLISESQGISIIRESERVPLE
jgi:hypothetical protein